MDYVTIIQTVVLGGGATALAIQILKSKLIPSDIPNKYPKVFNGVLSLVSAIVAVYMSVGDAIFSISSMVDIVTLGIITMLSAAMTYKVLLKSNSNEQVTE